jgi:hypothetical protein
MVNLDKNFCTLMSQHISTCYIEIKLETFAWNLRYPDFESECCDLDAHRLNEGSKLP